MTGDRPRRSDVGAAYDAVARDYQSRFAQELEARPLERGLLQALVELAGPGMIADIGCGPGHITEFLARRHTSVLGVDLSPQMIAVAQESYPEIPFLVASMLDLPVVSDAWAGVAALYSIIHLDEAQRIQAFVELARVLRRDGWLLLAFHVDSPDFALGQINQVTQFLGHPVQLDGHFLDPAEVEAQLADAGLVTHAKLHRQPVPGMEYPSRRCYLLAQRHETNLDARGAGQP